MAVVTEKKQFLIIGPKDEQFLVQGPKGIIEFVFPWLEGSFITEWEEAIKRLLERPLFVILDPYFGLQTTGDAAFPQHAASLPERSGLELYRQIRFGVFAGRGISSDFPVILMSFSGQDLPRHCLAICRREDLGKLFFGGVDAVIDRVGQFAARAGINERGDY